MALDLTALRAKLNELNRVNTKDNILWKPTKGPNTVRIVPLKSAPDNPFIELYFHYLGNKTYLSPLSFGERDPIAEFADQLRAGGGLSKEDYRETKKFVPQRRTFVPVIDRNKPQDGVRFWAFGKTVYSELLSVMADPEYGDITDPQAGRDIKVEFTPQEESDTGFAKTSIRIAAKETALTKDAEQLEKWLTEQPDLMSLYKRLSYDELSTVLKVYIEGPSAAPAASKAPIQSNDDWDEPSESPSAAKAKATPKNKASAQIEDDFETLFSK